MNISNKQYKKILGLNFKGDELEKQYWDRIRGVCDEMVFLSSDNVKLNEQLKTTDCLLVKLGAKIDKNIIDKAPNLRYIGMLGTGYGGIDVKYASKKNITVCNVNDYATQGVAEITFGMIFNHIRNLDRGLRKARRGNYSETGFGGTEIRGKTFGIIGLGNIGVRVAEIAQSFGANVQYWSQNRKKRYEKRGIEYKNLEDLLKTSDFISLNLALNPDTEGFLNKNRIMMIKENAVVINLSPMELVDIKTLSKRLGRNDFTFILDHADEMSQEEIDLIKSFPNCIIQLPIGYTTDEATTIKQSVFVKSIEGYLQGNPSNVVS